MTQLDVVRESERHVDDLQDRYTLADGEVFLTGLQALVRLPLEQARRDAAQKLRTATYVSGYEGSPLGGYDLELARRKSLMSNSSIIVQPGVNEELAATAVAGTQQAPTIRGARYDGVLGFWYGKAPGLDRASDAIRHGNLIGTHHQGGAVALVGDDAASKSSTLPCSSEPMLSTLLIPTLAPADPGDVLELGRHAVELSRISGLWSALKIGTNVADGFSSTRVRSQWDPIVVPEVMLDGRLYRHEVKMAGDVKSRQELERTAHLARLPLARAYGRLNGLNRIRTAARDAQVTIVAAGKTYLDLRQALRSMVDDADLERIGIRLVKLGMIFPIDPADIVELADGVREIIVVEEKTPFIETAIKEALYGRAHAPRVVGKLDDEGQLLFPSTGELDPDVIGAALRRRLRPMLEAVGATVPEPAQAPRVRTQLPLALPISRGPFTCSGCPHNSSLAVPTGSLVGAGTGCHSLVAQMPADKVGDVVVKGQMGGEGAQWLGISPFTSHEHIFQNLGDGTFAHSGSLAIRAAVAGGVNITYKILFNSAVAMTGGQRPVGEMSVAEIVELLEAEGVKKIIVTTEEPKRYRRIRLSSIAEVRERSQIVAAQEELAKVPGVTALIHDQECAAEKRRKRKRGTLPTPEQRVFINERLCEGCGDCGVKSSCLSVQPVETDLGRKTQIDQSSCNKDYTCLDGDCPSFMTVVPAAGGGAIAPLAPARTLAADDLPDPAPTGDGRVSLRITGIGGTGVVTVSQMIGMAAFVSGAHVRGLDMIGLAQKGGAVVSDIKVRPNDADEANRNAVGECDLYLGCDLLVAADAANLKTAEPRRTVAVVSTTEVPTGKAVVDTAVQYPSVPGLIDQIDQATTPGRNVFFDARAAATNLFGDDQLANVLLLGAASQTGLLPFSPAQLERAAELNGARVEQNIQALRWGRMLVADRASFDRELARGTVLPTPVEFSADAVELAAIVAAAPGTELARVVADRTADLIRYQNKAYARRYVEVVERARSAAGRADLDDAFAENVARQLYKLMAYKDEYEVARLALDPTVRGEVAATFGSGAKVAWKIHPPILRAMGLKKKLTLGAWFTPVFRLLYGLRSIRGTKLDIFGYDGVRRTERQLVKEYIETVDGLSGRLNAGNAEVAIEIAGLPDMVRGYEQIKLDNVARYRAHQIELLESLTVPVS
ncbi:indolepyruvate ferredoxin oxidoreductase family protein [Nocardioides sp. Bht2]|uniref:indolepyruvate ferredoxin oxidoreductase family protein n=1 Tax=Nocardioides sp. Bht2 TaxID=3392297 RepID=UPI0039B3ABE8